MSFQRELADQLAGRATDEGNAVVVRLRETARGVDRVPGASGVAIKLVDLADITDCGLMVTQCQTLGNAPPPEQLDQDVWTFTGSQGEDVTLTLTAQGSGSGNAQLILVAAISGVNFSRVDTSDLPNALSGTLPADGEYRIGVLEQPPGALVPGPIFRGDYCFTLGATQGGSATLAATASVE